MGAFKNEKNGTWYVQFRYTDWQGLRQQKLKRGFATKREAQEWERAFLTEKKADVTMPFKTFTELYEKDVRPKLKENTWLTKEHIIQTKILPYFEHKRLCDISSKDVNCLCSMLDFCFLLGGRSRPWKIVIYDIN